MVVAGAVTRSAPSAAVAGSPTDAAEAAEAHLPGGRDRAGVRARPAEDPAVGREAVRSAPRVTAATGPQGVTSSAKAVDRVPSEGPGGGTTRARGRAAPERAAPEGTGGARGPSVRRAASAGTGGSAGTAARTVVADGPMASEVTVVSAGTVVRGADPGARLPPAEDRVAVRVGPVGSAGHGTSARVSAVAGPRDSVPGKAGPNARAIVLDRVGLSVLQVARLGGRTPVGRSVPLIVVSADPGPAHNAAGRNVDQARVRCVMSVRSVMTVRCVLRANGVARGRSVTSARGGRGSRSDRGDVRVPGSTDRGSPAGVPGRGGQVTQAVRRARRRRSGRGRVVRGDRRSRTR